MAIGVWSPHKVPSCGYGGLLYQTLKQEANTLAASQKRLCTPQAAAASVHHPPSHSQRPLPALPSPPPRPRRSQWGTGTASPSTALWCAWALYPATRCVTTWGAPGEERVVDSLQHCCFVGAGEGDAGTVGCRMACTSNPLPPPVPTWCPNRFQSTQVLAERPSGQPCGRGCFC